MGRSLVAVGLTLVLVTGACSGRDESVVAPDAADIAAAQPSPVSDAASDSGQESEPTDSPTPSPVPSPTATPIPTATPVPTPTAAECLDGWPLDWRVAQLLLPLAVQADLGAAAEIAARRPFGGITLLGETDASLGGALADLQSVAAIPMIVSVDEEGGRVQRLRSLLGAMPSARTIASGEPRAGYDRMHEQALLMLELGITMNLAPVVDVGSALPIGDRSYGDDPQTVAVFATEVSAAIDDAGLTAVIKHFPGHGSASADSHVSVSTTPPLGELRESDLVVYESLLSDDIPEAVMVGHLVVPDLTEGLPATLSRAAVHDLLREELGFDGLVLTDAMNMAAVTSIADPVGAAVMALGADVDLVMIVAVGQVDEIVEGVVTAVAEGRLDESEINDSVVRVLLTKNHDPCVSIP